MSKSVSYTKSTNKKLLDQIVGVEKSPADKLSFDINRQ